jgi:hypothetical protein
MEKINAATITGIQRARRTTDHLQVRQPFRPMVLRHGLPELRPVRLRPVLAAPERAAPE